jgi:hypothetical protein
MSDSIVKQEKTSQDSTALQDYMHTDVTGALNQHTPSYWRLALPALGTRYIARYFTQFAKEPRVKEKAFDIAAGAWMLGITAFFAKRTYEDMKSLFSEVVAFEFDKKPEQVTVRDLLKSDNKMVQTACKNFGTYNAIRVLVNSTFFTSFLPGKSAMMQEIQSKPAVDLGVGANGAYLTAEILGRGRTAFEQVQSFVDLKLSSKNALGEPINAADLMQLFQRNAYDNDNNHVMDVRTTPEVVNQSQVLFNRMAELMNDTYLIRPIGKKDNFTLPKFLYLIGNNLINPNNVEQSLLYVEIANKSGIRALKDAVKEVRDGAKIEDLAVKYNVVLHEQPREEQMAADAPAKKFTDSIVSKAANGYITEASAPAAVSI